MKKLLLIPCLLMVALSCNRRTVIQQPPPPPSNSSIPANNTEVSLTGEAVCLPHKNPGEFQTLECAIGFKDTAGNYYALRGQPMEWWGTEVTGTFTNDTSGNYDIVGVIDWKQ